MLSVVRLVSRQTGVKWCQRMGDHIQGAPVLLTSQHSAAKQLVRYSLAPLQRDRLTQGRHAALSHAGHAADVAAVPVQGVWADPTSTAAAHMFQPWAVLEQKAGNIKLARELFKCAVKADPSSKVSWRVSTARMGSLPQQEPLIMSTCELLCPGGCRMFVSCPASTRILGKHGKAS